jgi:glycosyltransferase involved in cell wall biosynthesis
MLRAIDPTATGRWVRADALEELQAARVCFRPDPALGEEARLRLRAGPGAYSLCGLTHTLSTPGAARAITDLVAAPMMPWDAVICTSNAALSVVGSLLDEQQAYLAWRYGTAIDAPRPQLPVIPLGVHCADFQSSEAQRAQARATLGLGPDAVAALYAGRLALADKSHPFAMLAGLQEAAERSGGEVVLLLAGQFLNAFAEEGIRRGIADFAPKVRAVVIDGADAGAFRAAWAAADIFISLADSIQETFGLTPLEAMAAGLPCVVTDWNGYRDTVRHGVDGYRIDTWAPPPGVGERLAKAFEAEVIPPGRYVWGTTIATAADRAQLVDALCALIENPEQRRRMGEAGRERAREFDWSKVITQYQALWRELDARRRSGLADLAVRGVKLARGASPGRSDPFKTFAGYPTHHIGPATVVALREGASLDEYRRLAAHQLFREAALRDPLVAAFWSRLEAGEATVTELAAAAGCPQPGAALQLATLAKMGLVSLAER